jgi:hypothetical protein
MTDLPTNPAALALLDLADKLERDRAFATPVLLRQVAACYPDELEQPDNRPDDADPVIATVTRWLESVDRRLFAISESALQAIREASPRPEIEPTLRIRMVALDCAVHYRTGQDDDNPADVLMFAEAFTEWLRDGTR